MFNPDESNARDVNIGASAKPSMIPRYKFKEFPNQENISENQRVGKMVPVVTQQQKVEEIKCMSKCIQRDFASQWKKKELEALGSFIIMFKNHFLSFQSYELVDNDAAKVFSVDMSKLSNKYENARVKHLNQFIKVVKPDVIVKNVPNWKIHKKYRKYCEPQALYDKGEHKKHDSKCKTTDEKWLRLASDCKKSFNELTLDQLLACIRYRISCIQSREKSPPCHGKKKKTKSCDDSDSDSDSESESDSESDSDSDSDSYSSSDDDESNEYDYSPFNARCDRLRAGRPAAASLKEFIDGSREYYIKWYQQINGGKTPSDKQIDYALTKHYKSFRKQKCFAPNKAMIDNGKFRASKVKKVKKMKKKRKVKKTVASKKHKQLEDEQEEKKVKKVKRTKKVKKAKKKTVSAKKSKKPVVSKKKKVQPKKKVVHKKKKTVKKGKK